MLLGTFRKSTGTEHWAHSTDRLFDEAVPLIPREIFPSMYVRNLQQEKGIEKLFGAVRTECTEWALEGAVRSLVLWKKLNGESLLLKAVFLCRMIPVTGPQFQSALNASCSYLQVLGSPTCPCKFLKTLVIYTLKRLASGVQLPPWPPHFKGFSITFRFSYYRQFTGSWCYCSTTTPSSSSGFLWLNRSSRNIPWANSLSSDIDLA